MLKGWLVYIGDVQDIKCTVQATGIALHCIVGEQIRKLRNDRKSKKQRIKADRPKLFININYSCV